MKKTLFLSILIVFFSLCLVGCNNQKSNQEQSQQKDDYVLQEKCGKRCEEWVKKEYDGLGFHYSYKNHYNKKINKCFVLVSIPDGGYNQILFDVNENNKLGGYTFYSQGSEFCSMSGKECNSRKEWDALVKPYMEE